MAITTAVTRVAASTGLGTQDITIAGFGTPKAAIFIMSTAIADGVVATDANFCFGATDGTNSFYIAGTSEDGQGTSDAETRINLSNCIGILNPGLTTVNGEASFDSWIADGVRIDWTNAPSAAYLLTVVLFGGDSLSAFVGNQQVTDTVNAQTIVNNVGFESHLVFTTWSNTLNSGSVTQGDIEFSFGTVHNDTSGGITQRSYGHKDQSGQAAGQTGMHMSTLYACLNVAGSTGNLNTAIEYEDFTAAGFTLTERVGGGNDTAVMYLCLAGDSPDDFAVGTYATPVANGNDSEVGPGFEPQLVVLGMNHIDAINSSDNGADAGSLGLATFTDSAEFATSTSSEDGADPTNTQSTSDNTAVESPNSDGSAGLTASFVSMDTLGFTLNYTATLAAARQFWYAAIKAEDAPSPAPSGTPAIAFQPTSIIHEQSAELVRTFGAIPAWRWVSTYIRNAAESNSLVIDGSGGSPQSFFYTPPANYDFVASRMIILVETSGAMTALTNFANLGAALANGVQIVADGVLISTWQSNIDMFLDYFDVNDLGDVSTVAADTTILGRWSFWEDTAGQGIRIPNGKMFEVIVNDDLSSLSQFRMKIKGTLVQQRF